MATKTIENSTDALCFEGEPKVYLAGAITYADDGAWGNVWRQEIEQMYTGICWVNPLDWENPDMEYTGKDYMLEIVERDLMLIEASDAILMKVDTDIHQWGTPQEQFFADGINKPVILWYEEDPADLSVWCHVHGDVIARNMEEAVEASYFYATGEEYSMSTHYTTDPYFVWEEYSESLNA